MDSAACDPVLPVTCRSSRLAVLFALWACAAASLAAEGPLAPSAAALYQQAKDGRFFADAARLSPEIMPTSDGRSFLVAWKATPTPRRWIVSLHGTRGYATDDLAVWHPKVNDHDVGLLCVQWWFGAGDTPKSYYTPTEIYREIDLALARLSVPPGAAMLHGFSRGSTQVFAIAALDAKRGRRYFSLFVASSGAVSDDYPPTRAILDGAYGPRPLEGTRWVTAAGGRDPDPERSGIPGMRRTGEWLKAQGAVLVDAVEDPTSGHGALQHKANAQRVLDALFDKVR